MKVTGVSPEEVSERHVKYQKNHSELCIHPDFAFLFSHSSSRNMSVCEDNSEPVGFLLREQVQSEVLS